MPDAAPADTQAAPPTGATDATGATGATDATGPTSATGASAGASAGTPLFCRLLLNKTQGFILEILDAQGENQQSVTLDGLNLTLNVRGPSGQSTIIQTADRIALNAKDVSIDADTVRITSRAGTSLQSLGQTNVTSLADITMQTPGRLSQNCMTGFDVNTLSMSVNAIANASIQAVGGIGLFGIGAGVQIFGSTVSLTGLESSVIGLSLGLLAFDVNIGTPSGGGSGGEQGGGEQGGEQGGGTQGGGTQGGTQGGGERSGGATGGLSSGATPGAAAKGGSSPGGASNGNGPPQVIPGMMAGDLMGLSSTLHELQGGGMFKELSSQFPGGDLLSQGGSLVQQGSNVLQQGGSVLQQGGSLVQQGSSLLQQGGSVLQQGGSALQQGSSLVQQGSSLLQQGSSLLQQGSSALQQGSSLFQQGSSALQQGAAAGLQSIVSAAAQNNPLLGPLGGGVVSSLIGGAAQFLPGIQSPIKTAMNLTNMVKAFGLKAPQATSAEPGLKGLLGSAANEALSTLTPTLLALKAAKLMYKDISSPFQLPPTAELQLLHKAFQSVLTGASSAAATSPGLAAGASALHEILQLNQKLTSQLLQTNQLFVKGSQLLAKPPPPPSTNTLLNTYDQLLSSTKATTEAITGLPGQLGQAAVSQLSGLVENEAQVGSQILASQSQLASKVGSSLFGVQIGLPVGGTTPAVTPGLLPFNLINSLIGLQPPKHSGSESSAPQAKDLGSEPEKRKSAQLSEGSKQSPLDLIKGLEPPVRLPSPAQAPGLLPKAVLP